MGLPHFFTLKYCFPTFYYGGGGRNERSTKGEEKTPENLKIKMEKNKILWCSSIKTKYFKLYVVEIVI